MLVSPARSPIAALFALLVVCAWALPDGTAQFRTWNRFNTGGVRPGFRYRASIVALPGRDQFLVFGGLGGAIYTDTWIRDRNAWTLVATSGPSARNSAYLCHDPVRDRVLLVGGRARNGAALQDAWEWDGTSWQRLPDPPGPLATVGGAFHDPVRGGLCVVASLADGSWGGVRWDGSSWSTWASQGAPRDVVGGGYDPTRDRALAIRTIARQNHDLWEFDGTTWTQVAAGVTWETLGFAPQIFPDPAGPGLLICPRLLSRGVILRWDGQRISRLQPTNFNFTRDGVAYCPVAWGPPGIVAFGGLESSRWYNDMWRLLGEDAAAGFETIAPGCADRLGRVPGLRAVGSSGPLVGTTFQARVTGLAATPFDPVFLLVGDSSTTWAGQNLPFDLGGVGMPGCGLAVAPVDSILLANGGGFADWFLSVPLDPAVVGAGFFLQAVVGAPGSNALGVVVSDAAAVRVGTL